MTFSEAVRTCLREKYTDFNGRASRAEFWWFFLFTLLVSLVLTIPIFILVGVAAAMGDSGGSGVITVLLILWYIVVFVVTVALFIPTLSVGARRLHDWGQSAWLLLLYFVPCGNIALIVMWALQGTPGENAYGPRPAR